MTGYVHDYPTRLVVHSESDGDGSYLVDLCAFPYGKDDQGNLLFNGACQCRNFVFNCEPLLKKPDNAGRVYRCKHIRWARDNVLDYLLPVMKSHDPNLDETHLP